MNSSQQSPAYIWENVEAQSIKSSLTNTEYILRGTRSHLFLFMSGKGELYLENSIVTVEAPIFVWVPKGISSKFAVSAGTRGTVLSIPEFHLGTSLPSSTLGLDVRDALRSPIIKRSNSQEELKRFSIIMEMVLEELYENAPASQEAVRYNLTLLLIQIWRSTIRERAQSKAVPKSIFQNFVSLVELHATDHWTVKNYAEQIEVSKDRLTSAVKRATGKSPLSVIHRKLMQEAERQLLSSSHQISEIAYKLGFKDAAYFNRFFQKNAGMPPGKYRVLKQENESPRNFAAWP